MISNFSPKERGLVEAALAFANLQPIESNRQVEDLFDVTARIGDDSPLYKESLQPRLRHWLELIIRGNAGRAQVSSEVMQLMPREVRATPSFSMGRLSYDFQLTGVDAGCTLAVALLLDSDRGLTSRLQQCTLSTCGRFSVDFDARARPRKYCNVNHKILAHYEQSPERMRVWRKAA